MVTMVGTALFTEPDAIRLPDGAVLPVTPMTASAFLSADRRALEGAKNDWPRQTLSEDAVLLAYYADDGLHTVNVAEFLDWLRSFLQSC